MLSHSTGWGMLMLRVLVANAAMIAALMWFERPVEWWLAGSSIARSLQLGIAITVGAIVYFVVLAILGLRSSQFRLAEPRQE